MLHACMDAWDLIIRINPFGEMEDLEDLGFSSDYIYPSITSRKESIFVRDFLSKTQEFFHSQYSE